MKIVSLNKPYSILRWLVRDEAQAQANAAQAYRCVTAQNVTFVKSPHHGEVGFGNGTVAKCASAEGKQTFIAIPAHCFRLLIDAEGSEIGRLIGPAHWDSPEAKRLIEAQL